MRSSSRGTVPGSGVCRIAARRIYRVLGVEHIRHRRLLRRRSCGGGCCRSTTCSNIRHAAWLPTEDEKVNALAGAGIARDVLPRRLYQGAVGVQHRYFPHKLPVALDGERATFVFVQAEDETDSAVRTWGSQHAALWLALAAAGRAVEVVVVGRDPERLASAGRVLDKWASTPPESVTMAHGRRRRRWPRSAKRSPRTTGPPWRCVRRPEPSFAAHPDPRRRVRRKPPIHGRDHDGPDVALDAGAV